MSRDAYEIFEHNLDEERRHQGEAYGCHICGLKGIVGEDLWAAFHKPDRGQGHYWIHQSCAPRP